MGPPIFIGGNNLRHRRQPVLRHASMGPPIFIGGNERNQKLIVMIHVASMGPPIFIGGNSANSPAASDGCLRFNGATDFHRWKWAVYPGSVHGHHALQWGHRFSSVEMSNPHLGHTQPQRFNGATDFHRWKYENPRATTRLGARLQWGHRFSSVEINRLGL